MCSGFPEHCRPDESRRQRRTWRPSETAGTWGRETEFGQRLLNTSATTAIGCSVTTSWVMDLTHPSMLEALSPQSITVPTVSKEKQGC